MAIEINVDFKETRLIKYNAVLVCYIRTKFNLFRLFLFYKYPSKIETTLLVLLDTREQFECP